MIEQSFIFYVFVTMLITVLLVLSFIIPFYGLIRHRFKGLLLGCLIQPFICGIACMLAIVGIVAYQRNVIRKQRNAAMVTVREVVEDSIEALNYTWYLKADEECLFEIMPTDGDVEYPDQFQRTKLFDVVPLDSFRVCVDDRVVVAFDLNERKVTATDYDEPIEVVSVDWDKVNKYFNDKE